MSCCFCEVDRAANAVVDDRPNRHPRRFVALVQWAIPMATLALVPKCPACIAAYVLIFTGMGVSLPVAAVVRWTLIAVSATALACLLLRAAMRKRASA